MGGSFGGQQSRAADYSWVPIALLGALVLLIPLYDMWDDLVNLSWGVTATAVENAPLILLALGLVGGGIWLGRREWEPKYRWTVARWNLGVAAAIAVLYALVIAVQYWTVGSLKPWILALDGVLFGAIAAFAVGVNTARYRMARDDLEASRERYRTLTDDVLDTSEVATFILDDEFRVVWTNQAAAEYFGLDRGSILGRDKRELIETHIADLVDDSERFHERVTATYDDNTYTEEFECHVPGDADREERWLEHWSQPIETGLYEGGRIEHYTDITQLRRREQELREMYDVISDTALTFEEQVTRLVDIGRDLFDAEYGAFARIDQEADEYHLEVVRSERADLEAGDVVPFTQTHCERTIREDRTIQFETRPFDVDPKDYGTECGFEMYVGTPVYENDTVYGALCFLDRDEAEAFDDWQLTMVELMGNWMGYELNRKHLLDEHQQQLREQEAMFEEFVDAVDNYAIFTLDTSGRITSWNRGAERIKGYTEEEIRGEHFSVFYPDELAEAGLPEELLAESEATGQAHHEGWRVRKDGTRFWADVTIAARYGRDGEHVGYTKVVEDMTDQQEYERAIEHERERLEFINRILRHNILNGLNLVGARVDLLESQFVRDPDAREHLTTIRDRVDDLSSLIDTMRTFMDAIVRESDHETYPVSVRDELDAKVELARESYPDAVFTTHDLPDPSTEVVADELLGEVFENVLSNAVLHNDKETPRVEVWASRTTCTVQVDAETGAIVPRGSVEQRAATVAERERPAVVVHIADNGPGIPDGEKEAVLQKGVSELSEPGNGFGLYLVKEMLEAYGGRVDVRDNDAGDAGEGTVFDLVIPLADGTDDTTPDGAD